MSALFMATLNRTRASMSNTRKLSNPFRAGGAASPALPVLHRPAPAIPPGLRPPDRPPGTPPPGGDDREDDAYRGGDPPLVAAQVGDEIFERPAHHPAGGADNDAPDRGPDDVPRRETRGRNAGRAAHDGNGDSAAPDESREEDQWQLKAPDPA